MFVRKVSVENVRSFLDRQELVLDGDLSIIIGPNGGGKTNLLDAVVTALRRHLFSTWFAAHAASPDNNEHYQFRKNDSLNSMVLDKHSAGNGRTQVIEVDVEVTQKDIDNMVMMQNDANSLLERSSKKYSNTRLELAKDWDLASLKVGTRFTYQILDSRLQESKGDKESFRQYMQLFEIHNRLRSEYDFAALSIPLIFLPVTRTAAGLAFSVPLANFNDSEVKRINDSISSRSQPQIVQLAVGRLAQRLRTLERVPGGNFEKDFYELPNLKDFTEMLLLLGYRWTLDCINQNNNTYDLKLTKQGKSFRADAASSGEKELLTYLLAIFALNVRDAIIVVDEPELHLHPKWQKTLLSLFIKLAKTTGNQFLFATHSPTFVSPESIQYVSRVSSTAQESHILRLNADALPDAKHLLNIVNSQDNERLFFADEVILVEGMSDRIFFEAILNRFGRTKPTQPVIEVLDVGGKTMFESYGKLLAACQISYSIIADRDYMAQVGNDAVKVILKLNPAAVKAKAIEDETSRDGQTLIEAIDTAMQTHNWDHAKDIWDYIKARHTKVPVDLNDAQQKTINEFLEQKATEGIYILSQGALEAYLPAGHAQKDINKLIELINQSDFWEQLPDAGKKELEGIALQLLGKSNQALEDEKLFAATPNTNLDTGA